MESISDCTKNTSTNKIKSVFDYLIVGWMIYTSGIVTVAYNNFIFLIFGTTIFILLILFDSITIQYKSLDIILFAILESVTCIQLAISGIDGHIFNGSLKMILIFLFCYISSRRLTIQTFARVFSNIILVIASISIVMYWFNTEILASGSFPILRTSDITSYANLFVYCVSTAVPHRNCGVFWEPGAFQVFLNLALLFTLNYRDFSRRGLRVAIIIIAILTTVSTTGYICSSLILIAFLVSTDLRNRVKAILFLTAIFIAVSSIVLPIAIDSFSYKFGFESGIVSSNVTSRLNPFILDLYLIKDYFFGLPGIDYYAELLTWYGIAHQLSYHSSSCTLTMTMVVYGIIPGFLLVYGIVKFGRGFFTSKIRALVIVSVLIMFLTESFLTFGLYYFLAFMGHARRNKS